MRLRLWLILAILGLSTVSAFAQTTIPAPAPAKSAAPAKPAARKPPPRAVAPVTIEWDPATGATSYDVQRATAVAGPWTVVGANLACSTSPCQYVDSTPPGTGLVLYRLVTKNATGSNTLVNKGLWFCGDCVAPKLPGSPTFLQHQVQ